MGNWMVSWMVKADIWLSFGLLGVILKVGRWTIGCFWIIRFFLKINFMIILILLARICALEKRKAVKLGDAIQAPLWKLASNSLYSRCSCLTLYLLVSFWSFMFSQPFNSSGSRLSTHVQCFFIFVGCTIGNTDRVREIFKNLNT